MQYLNWQELKLTQPAEQEITGKYNQGFVFVRKAKNIMQQTRSLRIRLADFSLNSENRRILAKVPNLQLTSYILPLNLSGYSWQIHQLGKNFYQKKFGTHIFTANKIKQLLTDSEKSNFNQLLKFTEGENVVGYCIAYANENLLHYAYPFYDLDQYPSNYGMGMMLNSILLAQKEQKQYFYLGSATKAADKYKLQFSALEWFDQKTWQTDTELLKNIITNSEKLS